jgi:hypothetical protein
MKVALMDPGVDKFVEVAPVARPGHPVGNLMKLGGSLGNVPQKMKKNLF